MSETNVFGVVRVTRAFLALLERSENPVIVNVSSGMGSLAVTTDPQRLESTLVVLAYPASKTALNAFTVHLAQELRNTKIKVNSAHPGWVQTDLGGPAAPLSLSEGGKTSVQLATLPDDGPTGGYFHLGQPLPW